MKSDDHINHIYQHIGAKCRFWWWQPGSELHSLLNLHWTITVCGGVKITWTEGANMITWGQIVSANVGHHPHCVPDDLQHSDNNDEAVVLLFLMCL